MKPNKNTIRLEDKPLSELSMGQRRQFVRDRIDMKGNGKPYKKHGLSDYESRKEKVLAATREHGSGHTRSHGRRILGEQTKEDLKLPKRMLVGSGAALLALAVAASGEDKPAQGTGEPSAPSTTVVTAESGDTIWNLQKAEGTDGREIGEVVYDAVQLNGGSTLQPGDKVILIDDPNTPKTNN